MAGNESINEDNWNGVGIKGGKSRADIEMAAPRKMFGEPAWSAYEKVIVQRGVGAKPADAVDQRVLVDILSGSGKIINSQEEVGGWPELKKGKAAKDSDGDGVPDKWEKRHGMDRKNPDDGAVVGEDGYTALEHYLFSLTK